ncbi:nucleotide-binding universal stress UspA family protein [Natronocella acetinitrilica]|uniref:Nucleotide-binding universal stress UspA family protein n=1 Tax=Natronocella acetinitrilica TaxID=414046 RepID=A0AAE3GBA3_9GAMM|nr:universal stress protein [Natronocella acetinitrilica]MCP1677127.1 nucleotide-binding universal stress UspA family protein [Natronocella acetinitrilica]
MAQLPDILLVPVDGSTNASKAAAYATNLAEKLGCRVRLLFAFAKTPQDMFGVPTEMPNPRELAHFSPEAFERLRDETAQAAFGAARKAMGETGISVEEKIIRGEAGDAIIEHAAGEQSAMIIIGRRGLSRFRELLVGSTTQRVMHHANCPVLVVR